MIKRIKAIICQRKGCNFKKTDKWRCRRCGYEPSHLMQALMDEEAYIRESPFQLPVKGSGIRYHVEKA